MAGEPAVLISDELIHLLEDQSLAKAYFQELAGTQYPWDVDMRVFKEIRRQMVQIEKHIHNSRPQQGITCVIAGKGAFWVTREGLNRFYEALKAPVGKLKVDGPMPVWKLTSAEMFLSHLSNLRQMVLAVAYDVVLLHYLKDRLGGNQDFIQREFELSEVSVRGLLDEIYDQGDNLRFATQEEIEMIERCRITLEMIERGETTEQDLGYSQNDLKRVMQLLDRKCKEELPSYSKRLNAVHNQTQSSLREGEGMALTRASRWDMTYGMLQDLPASLQGHAQLSNLEREGMNCVVASREEELGPSESGQEALQKSKEAEQAGHPTEPEPPEAPQPQPTVEPGKPKKQINRMAYTSRRR